MPWFIEVIGNVNNESSPPWFNMFWAVTEARAVQHVQGRKERGDYEGIRQFHGGGKITLVNTQTSQLVELEPSEAQAQMRADFARASASTTLRHHGPA